MSDKFDRLSIYDVDWKIVDADGKEEVFTFKPLPFKHYPKIYKVLGKFQSLKVDESLPEEEQGASFMENLDVGTIEELLELEKVMVKNSYPDYDDGKLERFIMGNMFELIEPLVKLMGRAEKYDKRKTDASK